VTVLIPAQHLDILRAEGARLAAMPADFLDAPVPSLPDWTVERVVRHTGKVHQWVAGLLAAPPDVDAAAVSAALPGIPRGPECLPVYRSALDGVVAALSAHDPDRPVASFVGVDDVRFWCRRQAHEVTVHRIDAADAVHAAGGPTPDPIEPAGARDGIDEWLHVFVATRHAQRFGTFDAALYGRIVAINAGDDAGWTIRFAEDGTGCDISRAASRSALDVADARLAGAPEAVLLTCWRRRPLDTLDLRGDRGVAEVFHETLRF
jgi:uncharacterized protein (TIGR03083 family)